MKPCSFFPEVIVHARHTAALLRFFRSILDRSFAGHRIALQVCWWCVVGHIQSCSVLHGVVTYDSLRYCSTIPLVYALSNIRYRIRESLEKLLTKIAASGARLIRTA